MDIKKYYGKTSQGPYLNINEDSCECDLENSLFLVLDGLGGSGIGDKAANLIKEQLKSFYIKTTEDIDSTMPFFFNFHYNLEMNALVNSLICSHRLLLKENDEKPFGLKGGVTGVFACQSENIMNFINVGNGFCYLLRGDSIFRIFENEQSFRLLGDVNSYFSQKIPYSVLGMYYHLDYVVKEVKIQKGDQFLLGTDGALDRLSQEEVQGILLKKAEEGLQERVEQVLSLNNKKGNKDNQSIIMLNY